MCYNNSNNIKRKSIENKPQFYADTTCITRRSFMKYIQGQPREEYNPSWPNPHAIPYPKPSIYYPFTEDRNPFDRINISNEGELIYKNQRFDSPKEPFESRDPYSDIGATAKYLETKPTCFAIFGKPGLNTSKLAAMIASTWNCVLISGMPLIEREIELQTEKGLRIKQILETGGFVGYDIIMSLIRSRLKMRDVRHKGYIVEGLPLIPNENLDFSSYLNDTNDSCPCDKSTFCAADANSAPYEEEISKQVNEIFKEWYMSPSVIIYVTSPDEDVIEKRTYFRLDVSSGDIVDTTLTDMNANLERLISQIDIVNSGPISFNPYEELMNEERLLEQDREKHLVQRISDMRTCNIETQCDLYKKIALPVIDKWILHYNSENVIRVDGRTPISRMIQIINARLRLLPIPRVIMPQKMVDENEVVLESESREANIEDEFEDMSMEEVYKELAQRGTISPRFPWMLSPFEYFCPVELALGRTVDGLSKYSVRFMNKIYFLSSQRAMHLFTENPRPFLLPPYPRPVCKVVVFGPEYSGKSDLCCELSRTFEGTLINVKEKEQSIVEERQKAKITIAMQEKLAGVINDLKRSLKLERQRKESKRQMELQSWYEKMLSVVTRLFELLDDIAKSSDIPNPDQEVSPSQTELESLRETLRIHQLENIEKDVSLQDEIRADNKVLLNYAPEYLVIEEPPVRELIEYDPEVLDMLEDRVKYLYHEPINLTVSEKADIIIESINNVTREEIDDDLLRDPCYIVDGMYTDYEIWKKIIDSNIIFEHAIVMIDEEPFAYLIDKMKRYNENTPENEDEGLSDENIETGFKRKVLTMSVYIDHLKQFVSQWKLLEDKVKIAVKNHIIVDLPTCDDIPQFVVREMKNLYTVKATILSDRDKERNREFYEFDNLLLGVEEDVEEGNDEKDLKPEDNTKENYLLGESGSYCPVALTKHKVYWKGSEDFSVSYMNKIYLCSTEEAMEEFVRNPQDFSIPYSKPARNIPPLRVCIVGSPGSGKSTLCDSISREYGMVHVDYYNCFSEYMKNRAMYYFSQKDTLIEKKEPEKAELPEDLSDRNYDVDSETVRYFIRQYWDNGRTLPDKMRRECLLDFFLPPFDTRRIIFDGFPSCAEDARLVFEKFAVPEIIIELRYSLESCIERMVPVIMEYWETKEEEKRHLEQHRYNKAMEDYMSRREIWIRKMLRETQKKRRMEEREAQEAEYEDMNDDVVEIEPKKVTSELLKKFLSEEDNLNFDIDDDTINELEDIWKDENPEPELILDSEDAEDVQDRVINGLQIVYNNEATKLESARAVFEGGAIPWIEIDAEKNSDEVRMEVMTILDPYVFRNVPMLERSYAVDCELAERLLDHGYYLLSSFGRWCPVQLYKKENSMQMFLPLEVQHEIWPVIHRQYIYFLCGKEAEIAFRKDPLKYLQQDSCSPVVPLRISIIGPPKCGKSTLAKRFGKKYGMKIITPGTALRDVLKRFSWTNLAEVIQSHLQAGHTVPDEYVIRAVEMFSMDPRAVSQGLIFDGFPSKRKEVELLTFRGLQPMIVLDLKADREFSLECLSSAADNRKCPPTFSQEFFTIRYAAWKAEEENYRTWLQKYSKNIIALDATKSKAYTWVRAEESVLKKFASLKLYFRECNYDKVHSLEYMCVSPYEFRKWQSEYEAFCPLCLMLENAFVTSGPPPKSQGMVQFRGHFYWICSNHLSDFHLNPLKYLPPNNTARLPDDRPRILDGDVDLQGICWGSLLQAEGYCVVTYLDNLPRRRLVPGKMTLGISYKSKLYFFCTPECREKFLMYVSRYADAKPKLISTLPVINIWKLPDLSFLEQTVADIIIQALNEINVLRPKIPGLSPAQSAAIYIGVFLKIHNNTCKLQESDIYETVNERMMCRAQILKHATKNMTRRVNPFVYLPYYSTTNNLGENVSQFSEVSSKMINMIKFRRTSPTQLLVDPDDDPDY